MSDDSKKGPSDSSDELVKRYQRRGGSARKDPEPKPGLWQRLKRGRKGREDELGEEQPGEAARAPADDDAPREPERPQPPPQTATAPQSAAAGPAAVPSAEPDRLAVELVLPTGQRIVLLVVAPRGRAGGLLQLVVEPPPANDPRIVNALVSIGHGGGQPEPAVAPRVAPPPAAPQAPPRRPTPAPAPAATRPPAAPPPAAPAAQPSVIVEDAWPAPEAAGGTYRKSSSASFPSVPEASEDPSSSHGQIDLPPAAQALEPIQFRGAKTGDTLPLPTAPEAEHPAQPVGRPAEPEPEPPRSGRRRLAPAAVRGGAAERMFEEEEQRGARAQKATQEAPRPPREAPPARPQRREAPPAQEEPTPRRQEPAMPVAREQEPWPEPSAPQGDLYPQDLPELPRQAQEQTVTPTIYPAVADALGPEPYHPGVRSSQLPIVGIDFGTSYSLIGLMRAGMEVIPDENGEILLPSVISFPKPGQVLIGAEARKRMGGEAQFTVVSPKRLLGRLYKDPQVAQLLGGLAFRTFAGTDKFVRFEAHGEIYTVTDICALILGRLRERACRFLDAEVSKAVFAVPVGFGTLQRSALEVAARKAGLEVVGLLTEPSAAVLAHGFRGQRGGVAVYDFGGGTFDFSILEVSETAFQVRCAGGDPWLGGDDFDHAMANVLADRFWKETGVDLRNRAVEWQALLFACEHAKRILSDKSAAEVRVDNLLHTSKGSKGLRYKLSRKEFNAVTHSLIDKSIAIAEKVMAQARISPQQVDAVVLTGGTSLIPAVRDAVARYFRKKLVAGDADLAVVRGAALRAAELGGEAVAETSLGGRTLREVAGRTIGAGPKGGPVVTLFERDTPLPAEIFKAFYTQFDGQTEMVVGLYEESKSRVDESRTIGHLRYKGLRPAPAGESRIDFTFFLDEDGILHVTAVVEGKEYTKSIRLE